MKIVKCQTVELPGWGVVWEALGLSRPLVLGSGGGEKLRGRWGISEARRFSWRKFWALGVGSVNRWWAVHSHGRTVWTSCLSINRVNSQSRYHTWDKDLRKIHTSARVGNVMKVQQILLHWIDGLNASTEGGRRHHHQESPICGVVKREALCNANISVMVQHSYSTAIAQLKSVTAQLPSSTSMKQHRC